MQTAVELFEAVTRELNIFNSPSFDAADFNLYINRAVNVFVEEQIAEFEKTQQSSNALRPIIRQSVYNLPSNDTADVRQVTLPSSFIVNDSWQKGAFYRLWLCEARIKCKKEIGRYKTAQEIEHPCQKLSSDMKGFITENTFLRPSIERFFYQHIGNDLLIYFHTRQQPNSEFYLKTVYLEYLIKPTIIQLAEPEEADGDYSSVANSDFGHTENQKIVDICVQLFRDDLMRRRAQDN